MRSRLPEKTTTTTFTAWRSLYESCGKLTRRLSYPHKTPHSETPPSGPDMKDSMDLAVFQALPSPFLQPSSL